MSRQKTILCVASYFKGDEFLRAAKREGAKVILMTSEHLKEHPWPKESIDEFYYIPSGENQYWNMDHVILGLAYKMRHEKIDVIVALDDYDVEKAARLREHFRVAGMGETRSRYFRDKLAMRMEAKSKQIPVPEFTSLFFYDDIRAFMNNLPAPWLLKPRSAASATGIKKIHNQDELWRALDKLGDEQTFYLMEEFLPGNVYHVDSLSIDSKIVFQRAHQYMNTPMEVSHEGGIFRSHNVVYGSSDEQGLFEINKELLKTFGLRKGASHSEFIKANRDGKFDFLETSARVGGANLMEMLEASSGINLWAEWAKLELLDEGQTYKLPKVKKDYAGIIISLAKQQYPDMNAYTDSEIFWRMHKEFHAGLIVNSPKLEQVHHLLNTYLERFKHDFHTALPPAERPTN